MSGVQYGSYVLILFQNVSHQVVFLRLTINTGGITDHTLLHRMAMKFPELFYFTT